MSVPEQPQARTGEQTQVRTSLSPPVAEAPPPKAASSKPARRAERPRRDERYPAREQRRTRDQRDVVRSDPGYDSFARSNDNDDAFDRRGRARNTSREEAVVERPDARRDNFVGDFFGSIFGYRD